jgi:hypothetical protein
MSNFYKLKFYCLKCKVYSELIEIPKRVLNSKSRNSQSRFLNNLLYKFSKTHCQFACDHIEHGLFFLPATSIFTPEQLFELETAYRTQKIDV